MVKILLIDLVSWKEHISYNNYWIKTLNTIGVSYDFACIDGYANLLTDLKASKIYNIEGHLGNCGYKNSIKVLLKLYRMIDCNHYNWLIFTTVNKMSFISSPFFSNSRSVLVSHVWPHIPNIVHKSIYKIIDRRHTLVCLDNFLKKWLDTRGIKTTLVVHPIPYDRYIQKEPTILNKQFTIFSPSKGVDKEFVSKIINNEEFNRWLSEKKIKLLMRSNDIEYYDTNIQICKGYIDQNQYNTLFNTSNAILIAYPTSFQTRVSNVFYEAVSAEKPIILKNGTHLDNYLDISEDGIYSFNDITSLKESINSLLRSNIKPNFEEILKSHSILNMINQVKNLLIRKDTIQ